MKRIWTRVSLVLCCVILLGLTWLTCASGGDAADPVVSLSYLSNQIHAELTAAIKSRVDSAAGVDVDDLREKRTEALGKLSNAGLIGAASDKVLAYLQQNGKYFYYSDTTRFIHLQKDDVISGAAGTQILLRSGSGIANGGSIIDLTAGKSLAAGGSVSQNARYMLPARDRSGVRITSQSATVGVQGFYRVTSVAYEPQYVAHAQALKRMGLFQGTSTGFNLGKTATRAEAATMLVRLLGEESVALRGTSRHPFGDVPTWANGYIGHAYSKGYTNGTSANRFTPNNPVSATQYMTFLLRALGYDDAKGDFQWDAALAHAVKIGLISKAEQDSLNKSTFYRDQMVYLSYRALLTARKGSTGTLLEYLRVSGVVSASSIDEAMNLLR
ncbi:MAG: S-layer homology domain-containing protein [Ruminococcaceae bacterium]|nr:S-layer homology domain-containing protein [Oscillospiraceae bacterium]